MIDLRCAGFEMDTTPADDGSGVIIWFTRYNKEYLRLNYTGLKRRKLTDLGLYNILGIDIVD